MDELYVVARRVLLDALVALEPHRDAITLVGAQALYLRAGEADLAVAPYTTDCDLALDPALLGEFPPLERALAKGSFVPAGPDSVGIWLARRSTPSHPGLDIPLDLLVPRSVSPGKGRRAARLRGHEPTAARMVRGLEGAIVDFDWLVVRALEPEDPRAVEARVAGPAALLVAKLHKIDERKGTARADDKDALDVFRLLRAVPTEMIAERARLLLADERSRAAGERGRTMLRDLFHRGGAGTLMVVRAVEGLMDEAEVRAACAALAEDLLEALGT